MITYIEFEDFDTYLRKVYLQRSSFKINSKHSSVTEQQIFQPVLFHEAIKEFKSGQVYNVLVKDK